MKFKVVLQRFFPLILVSEKGSEVNFQSLTILDKTRIFCGFLYFVAFPNIFHQFILPIFFLI